MPRASYRDNNNRDEQEEGFRDEEDYPNTNDRRRRRRRRRQDTYDSVEFDEDDGYVPRRRRRASSVSYCSCCWLSFMVLIIISMMGVILFRYEQKAHPDHIEAIQNLGQTLLHPDQEDSTSDDAVGKTSHKEKTTIPSGHHVTTISYHPQAGLAPYDPFGLNDDGNSPLVVPQLSLGNNNDDDTTTNMNIGYLTQPNIVGRNLVLIAEGDLYWTQLPSSQQQQQPSMSMMPAMKLTTTVGNVQSPILHPTLPLVAFSATYTGHRELYLLDLRENSNNDKRSSLEGAKRLTYTDTGILKVVGWKDESTITISARNQKVGLPDTRMYTVTLKTTPSAMPTAQEQQVALGMSSIPLSQALNGVYHSDSKCWYFTRFKQSSNTIRYVGGTAESLWAYCEGQDRAISLTAEDYIGTSKNPKIVTLHLEGGGGEHVHEHYLLFQSDRDTSGTLEASTMNLFATRLPTVPELYSGNNGGAYRMTRVIPLTQVSCQFNGMSLQEYSVSPSPEEGHNRFTIILRIGADLYRWNGDLQSVLQNNQPQSTSSNLPPPTLLPIKVYSDFHEQQERLLPVMSSIDANSMDAFDNAVTMKPSTLIGVRGQLFVAPVISRSELDDDDYEDDALLDHDTYNGAGMNMPLRRYRVAPGTMNGGMVRVLTASHVPMPQEEDETIRRLAVVLATYSTSEEEEEPAEQGFYLIEIHADAAPSFVDPTKHEPFTAIGSVTDGGLGSVYANTVSVSPCGRRLAWTDTDGRICVTTLPFYSANNETTTTTNATSTTKIHVLKSTTVQQYPLVGTRETVLSWSPGGRYLAIQHAAMNQFMVISIQDCGDPSEDNVNQTVPDINLTQQAVTVTPSRFNSMSPYWGKSAMDFAIATAKKTLKPILDSDDDDDDDDNVDGGATMLYFLSDRDIVTEDVTHPWGYRAPQPHFTDKYTALYALPLLFDESGTKYDAQTQGWYAGGGASELYAQGVLDLAQKVKEFKKKGGDDDDADDNKSRRLTDKALLLAATVLQHRRQQRRHRRRLQDPPQWNNAPSAETTNTNGNSYAQIAPSHGGGDQEAPTTTTSYANIGSNRPSVSTFQADNAPVNENKQEAPSAASQTAFAATSAPLRLTQNPTAHPSSQPSFSPTKRQPTSRPSRLPHPLPTVAPSTTTTTIPSNNPSVAPSAANPSSVFPNDVEIDFASVSSKRLQAIRIVGVPEGPYTDILSQCSDDPSMLLIMRGKNKKNKVKLFSFIDFPSDEVSMDDVYPAEKLVDAKLSTSRQHVILQYNLNDLTVLDNTIAAFTALTKSTKLKKNMADTSDWGISVWPHCEYEQMYNDAWRMLRDYFYDKEMHGVDWKAVYHRYHPLVRRCAKREDLDDILSQMASELSALHVFVYGGEYSTPFEGHRSLQALHEVASLGATLERSAEYQGYIITQIPQPDPDYNILDGAKTTTYSPLSEQVLQLSGQQGLFIGDVIVAVNGESVWRVPDIGMMLRGQAGRTVRLEVLRQPQIASDNNSNDQDSTAISFQPEPVLCVPIKPSAAMELRYAAWEYHTQQLANQWATDAGFTVGYIHLRSMMGPADMDAFARGFFPNYQKQAIILDVRHNNGGNIDSWILDILQRQAWQYFQGRSTNIHNGGLGWDQQYAFRGHLVVLIDEKTSSDGEGVSRGISELGLGKLVGTRTWGGGIWLSSDNKLVDGGIATAPEIGTYSQHFGWGMGIEQQGVTPDVLVDNNPRVTFEDNQDEQLQRAISVLADWLRDEPVVLPPPPGPKPNHSLDPSVEQCTVT
eukprot:CAMPEP_0194226998 /NCGR_PEP_ID=MMETSP0156-20130528/42631_1 /TAXON_ID=33649 /ORGANISM="Thalassionema nitzschioides, Strain L26-B" /LENGTH=1764 /DNA_ID=CAMNT_0038959467 /DNA_START=204 /DNA_END=5498 /DNA_ORIENTATION=-